MKDRLSKCICLIFLVCYSWGIRAQQPEIYNTLIDFNRQFNFYHFEQLRSYIIKNGDRKTYCPNYENNPHYRIEDLSLEIYLNPTNKDSRISSEKDYNVIYLIEGRGQSDQIHYYLYLTPKRDVFLYDYDRQFEDSLKKERCLLHLEEIIKEILVRAKIIR